MAHVVTILGVRPGERVDGVPWENAEIQESQVAEGPWTTIDTQALVPIDADPANPQFRDFTTSNAALTDAWYRINFLDGIGGDQATDPMYDDGTANSLPLSIADLRARSPYLAERFPSPSGDAALSSILNTAMGLLKSATCRTFDSTMPEEYVYMAIQALVLKVESMGSAFVSRSGAKVGLRSFQAGSYSESYFGQGEAAKNGMMDPNPQLDELLKAIATDDCLDNFLATNGKAAPASIIVAPSYRDDFSRY